MDGLKSMVFVACIVLSAGCVQEETNLQQAYLLAIEDARIAEEDEICRDLTAITDSNRQLLRKDGKVLVVTWTSRDGYLGLEDMAINTTSDVWVTVAPQISEFLIDNNISARDCPLKIEQLLGLPPHNGKKCFAEFWVRPEDLFRPSPDPEITDREAQLNFPANASPDHITWFNRLRETSYGEDGYPWTRLGYTYDWGSPGDETGISEFVIRAGSEIEVRSVTPTGEYCRSPPLSAGNFTKRNHEITQKFV